MWKNVHPVYGTGIQTHDLQNASVFVEQFKMQNDAAIPYKFQLMSVGLVQIWILFVRI